MTTAPPSPTDPRRTFSMLRLLSDEASRGSMDEDTAVRLAFAIRDRIHASTPEEVVEVVRWAHGPNDLGAAALFLVASSLPIREQGVSA